MKDLDQSVKKPTDPFFKQLIETEKDIEKATYELFKLRADLFQDYPELEEMCRKYELDGE
tara:strand:- start:1974 stop:2153 length:180 start_codon:yes stop_codon:yes gene_type:complete